MTTIDDVKSKFTKNNAGFWIGPGWYSLVCLAHEHLIYLDPDIEYMQIKEKFGTLRIQLKSFGNSLKRDDIVDVISHFELMSEFICEICGEAGYLKKKGSFQTLCDDHRAIKDSFDTTYEQWAELIGSKMQGIV